MTAKTRHEKQPKPHLDDQRQALKTVLVSASLIAVMWVTSCAEPLGNVSVVFEWSASPPETTWVWARVERRGSLEVEGDTLAETGPFEYVQGEPLSLTVDRVPNGTGLRIVVECREGPTTNLPVRYYGISDLFDLSPGATASAEVLVQLQEPAATGTISLRFGGLEKSVVGDLELASAEIVTSSVNAASVLLSNSLSFTYYDSFDIQNAPDGICTKASSATKPQVCTWPSWDLTQGLPTLDDGPIEGRYFVYSRFVDKNGYAGSVSSASVDVDISPPNVLSASLHKHEQEGMEHATLLLALDEPLATGAEAAVLHVEPNKPSTPSFDGPERVGLSTSYQWLAKTPLENIEEDKTAYSLTVVLTDKVGNQSGLVPLNKPDGALLTYSKGCDCSSGPCCVDCYFQPKSVACEQGGIEEVACPWGEACGDHIGHSFGGVYCSGYSSGCDGDPEPWTIKEECSYGYGCHVADSGVSCAPCGGLQRYPEVGLQLFPACPMKSGKPPYGCNGGSDSLIMEICGHITEDGLVQVTAYKSDGVLFGDRPYQVREFSSLAPPGEQCTHLNPVKSELAGVSGSAALEFPPFLPRVEDGSQHSYCVTASVTDDDSGYDGSAEQEAWYCSGKVVVTQPLP